MAAPTLIAFAEVEGNATSSVPVTTASISWQTNDVVVVVVGNEGNGTTTLGMSNTGTGLSFGTAQQVHQSAGADGGAGCWAAVATASSSGTFSGTTSGANQRTVIGAYVFRGSAGIGNSVLYTGVSPTGASLTPTGADGSIVWIVIDWATAAATAASPTATSHNASTPGPTASPVAVQQSPNYTYYVAELDDQTSAGAVSYGITGSGTGPFTIIAIETKSSGGTSVTVIPPARVDVLIA